MPDNDAAILAELAALLRLTSTEQAVAQIRIAQARTERIAQDLRDNASEAGERMELISARITALGGIPDLIGGTVGRAGAAVRATLEQGVDLTEALLGDLALEHQLSERARLLRLLAQAGGHPEVADLAESLEAAHRTTIGWLHERLEEVAAGSAAGLRPTPLQATVAATRRAALVPLRRSAATVSASMARAGALREQTGTTLAAGADLLGRLRAAAVAVAGASRDAGLQRVEEVAREEGADSAADAVHGTRVDLGAVSVEELAIPGYDNLNLSTVVGHVQRLTAEREVRAVLAYEGAHRNRKGVVQACEHRLAKLEPDHAGA